MGGRPGRHREQDHHRADAVGLAEVDRVTGRIRQRDPGRAIGQPGGAEADRPLGPRLGIVGLQVEVELLRVLLSGQAGATWSGARWNSISWPSAVRRPNRSESLRMTSHPASSA